MAVMNVYQLNNTPTKNEKIINRFITLQKYFLQVLPAYDEAKKSAINILEEGKSMDIRSQLVSVEKKIVFDEKRFKKDYPGLYNDYINIEKRIVIKNKEEGNG